MTVVAFAPGRVNLIGEHTDYNGGLSLPFAIEEGIEVTAAPIDGEHVVVRALDRGEEDRFALASPERVDGWRAFPRGIVAELRAAGHAIPPAELEIRATLAEGAGLSSSAALEVALSLALLGLAGEADGVDRVQLARLCSRVENHWAGAQTGLLDQLASLLGEEGAALRIDFATLALERIPLRFGDWRLIALDSGERHELATSGYNDRRAECARAAQLLGIDTLRDATAAGAAGLPEPLDRRTRHVLTENARVDATIAAVAVDDLAELGRLLDASHASLRDDYDASTDAVEATVRRLHDVGAAGARMMGGGFGGTVLALLPPDVAIPEHGREVRPARGAHLR